MTYDRLFDLLTLNGRELFHTEVSKKMLANSNFIFRFTFCFGFLRYLSLPRKGTRICQNFYIHTFCNNVSRRIVHLLRTIFHMNLHWLADKHLSVYQFHACLQSHFRAIFLFVPFHPMRFDIIITTKIFVHNDNNNRGIPFSRNETLGNQHPLCYLHCASIQIIPINQDN